ncbi:MAG: DUF2997 domain-containing protein [Prochlorotrichaceae cyanobacterium]|jgi:lipase chaperone LimK
MSMETLEFVIHADGRVEEKVTGIVGTQCAEVTAEIEAQLGRVLQQENTADYFAQEAQVHSETTLPAQSSTW